VQDNKEDWKNTAVIESASPAAKAPQDGLRTPEQPDTVRLLEKDTNNVSIMARSKAAGYLILTDTFYPGWTVSVDGKPGTIYAANHAFRAVYLPAGNHQILFTYLPGSFIWGLRMLMFALGLSLVVLLLDLVRIFKGAPVAPAVNNSSAKANIESFSASEAKY
jgi:hypothetical protein